MFANLNQFVLSRYSTVSYASITVTPAKNFRGFL